MDKEDVLLSGVPETMLLTLYYRALVALAPENKLHDPEAVRIYQSLDYDFVGRFGRPVWSESASRSLMFDGVLKDWIQSHPDGFVASLGEGLETQNLRLDNGRIRWLSVDLPDAIAVRERFLKPTERFRHSAKSALDFSWMDEVPTAGGVFIVIQGLLMYFQTQEVRNLLCEIARRFPHSDLLFDYVPAWISRKHPEGLKVTTRYRIPPMKWGVDYGTVEPTLREWIPGIESIERLRIGRKKWLGLLLRWIPPLQNKLPGIVHVRFGSGSRAI